VLCVVHDSSTAAVSAAGRVGYNAAPGARGLASGAVTWLAPSP
jgi:hypothetical protein